jgi:hypothetical protein
MKSGTWPFSKILRPGMSLKKTNRSNGGAAIAGISMKDLKRPRCARHAIMNKSILKFWLKIGKWRSS